MMLVMNEEAFRKLMVEGLSALRYYLGLPKYIQEKMEEHSDGKVGCAYSQIRAKIDGGKVLGIYLFSGDDETQVEAMVERLCRNRIDHEKRIHRRKKELKVVGKKERDELITQESKID